MRFGRARFGGGRVEVLVRLGPGEPRRVSHEVAGRALALLPGLAAHRCGVDGGVLPEEIEGTQIAHLFEHVLLELMVRTGAADGPVAGETTWDAELDGPGVYAVSVSCADARACRMALRAAKAVMRHLLDGGPAPRLPHTGLTRLQGRC